MLNLSNIKLKVSSLLSQWVRRFTVNPSGWTLLMTYWFLAFFGTSPSVVLARPHSFNHSVLPAFYSALLLAWRSLDGSFDDRLSSLVFASRDPHPRRIVSALSSKIAFFFCSMKITLFLTVLKNLGLPLVHFIGRPLDVNFILLILTVHFWTSLGRSIMVFF